MPNLTEDELFQFHLDALNCMPDFKPFVLIYNIFGDYIRLHPRPFAKLSPNTESNEDVAWLHTTSWGQGFQRLTTAPRKLSEKEVGEISHSIFLHIKNLAYKDGMAYLSRLIGALHLTYPSEEIERSHVFAHACTRLGEGQKFQQYKEKLLSGKGPIDITGRTEINISDDEFRYVFCIDLQLGFMYGVG